MSPAQTLTWTGHFENGAVPAPEACAAGCDTYTLTVGLGDGYWNSNPGAVQIGIQWWPFGALDPNEPESEGEYDDIDLYVYDSAGAMLASSVNPIRSSAGIASTAQVVDLPNAPDGVYTVLVVPSNVVDRSYKGLVMVQSYAPSHGGHLLPDLRSLQPTNFHLEVGTLSLSRAKTDALSCYPDETAQDPDHPTRCLRFDAGHSNLGDGPLLFDIELSSAGPVDDNGTPALGGTVTQVIRTGEGGTIRRAAGAYVFHLNHAHIHYRAFAEYSLVPVDPAGPVVASKKSDFCMIDVQDMWFGLPGNGARDHHFPQCNTFDPESVDDEGRIVQHQGINRGWADVYTWDLPGQYIDITDLDDGIYDVVNAVNPLSLIDEIDTGNNVAATRIRLQDGVITCIPVNDAAHGFGECPIGTTPD